MQPLDPRQIQGLASKLEHLLAVMLCLRNVTRRVGHQRRLLVKRQAEPVVPFPGVLTEEVEPGLSIDLTGIEGGGTAGGTGGLQIQPGKLHPLLRIFDQVDSMIQLIDNSEKNLLVITRSMCLQQ